MCRVRARVTLCSVLSNGTLTVSEARAENEGNYLCRADNQVGEAISKLAEVNVNGTETMLLSLFSCCVDSVVL